MSGLGLPSDFVRKGLLLRSGYVRELAAASYHISTAVAVIFLALQVAGALVGG